VHARRIAGIGARSRYFTGDFTDSFTCEIRMIERDRAVDQAYWNFGPANRPRHQRWEPDQIQATGTAPDLAVKSG